MSGRTRSLHTLAKVLRSEGPAAVRDRIADLRARRKHLRTLRRRSAETSLWTAEAAAAPLLNLSPLPPFPRRGGSQIQMLDRLEVEARHRSVALAYPHGGGWLLEIRGITRGELVEIKPPRGALAGGVQATTAAIVRAARIVGTDRVHLENMHGLPMELPQVLNTLGLQVMISVHDFSCFCRRPHLVEVPSNLFCSYSTDPERCRSCLEQDWGPDPGDQAEYRRVNEQTLRAARTVIFPSDFLRERYTQLFLAAGLESSAVVVEPSTRYSELPPPRPNSQPHLALVGGVKQHKGGALLDPLLARLREELPNLACTAFGDGEPEILAPLKRKHRVAVRGYYRSGDLPLHLRRASVDVAVLPSIWPESYGLVVDECLRAGVPVVAFDLGAPGERLRRLRAGRVVHPGSGAQGLAEAVIEELRNPRQITDEISQALPTPERSAEAMLRLYDLHGPDNGHQPTTP